MPGNKLVSFENLKKILLDQDIDASEDFIYIPNFRIDDALTEPYRSEYYCVGLIKEGELALHVNLVRQNIKAPAIILIDTNTIKNWEKQIIYIVLKVFC